VFGWLIAGIFRASPLGDHVVLKGGNALRKGYFPTTRFSDDLDFSTAIGLSEESLLNDLNSASRFVQEETGVKFDLDRNQLTDVKTIDRDRRLYKARLYFHDFSGNADHITLKIRVDVTEYDRLLLPAQTRRLIHQYSDADSCSTEIRCVALEEALADKLKCLLQRRYSHDLFDLVYAIFIRRDLDVDRNQLVTTFLRKTIFEASPIAALRLLLGTPFDGMRRFWDGLVCPEASRLTFEQALALLGDGLRVLFAPFSYGQHLVPAYFPPELRNPILEAGSNLTLLHLTYDGIPRIVEPYSLAFKRRKDGVAQEYFYAWDRTGGRSGGPGVRSFLQAGVQAIENTDEVFEPRFEVELRKAGEPRSADFFSGGWGHIRQFSSSTRQRTRATTRRYVIQCSYCGKRFYRSQPTTRLNPHKDGYGNRCYGRVGVRVS
jgi:predicted nucleotidyltransferase component of viral defense system